MVVLVAETLLVDKPEPLNLIFVTAQLVVVGKDTADALFEYTFL